MVKENQEDDLKNKEQEKPEGLPEIKPNKETSDGIMKKGQQDVAIIEAGIEEEIGGMEKTAKSHDVNQGELIKIREIERNIEEGVDKAKGNLKKEIEPLENKEKEHSEEMFTGEIEEVFNGIIIEAENIRSSQESLLEKRKKIDGLLAQMDKIMNNERTKNNYAKTENWRDAGNLLHKIRENIDKDPDTRKEILKELEINRKKTGELLNGHETEQEVRKKMVVLEKEKKELELLFADLDKGDRDREDGSESAGKVGDVPKNNILEGEKSNEDDAGSLLKKSEEQFDRAKKSIETYNQTLPNYFEKRSESLGKIINELKNKNADKEIISLASKIIIKDRKMMIESMCRKEHVDIYDANPGVDNSKMEAFDDNLYVDYLLKENTSESEVGDQLKKVNEALTAALNDFTIDLFSDEYVKAASFVELARKSKNIKERQVYYVAATHILDGIEKGMKDDGVKAALKNKGY